MLFNFAAMYLRTLFHIVYRILFSKLTAKNYVPYQSNAVLLLPTVTFIPFVSYSTPNIYNTQNIFFNHLQNASR